MAFCLRTEFLSTHRLFVYATAKDTTTVLSKNIKVIAWVFVMSIHPSELDLLLTSRIFAFLSTIDFLSTVMEIMTRGKSKRYFLSTKY